jgi:hypothetical protein
MCVYEISPAGVMVLGVLAMVLEKFFIPAIMRFFGTAAIMA